MRLAKSLFQAISFLEVPRTNLSAARLLLLASGSAWAYLVHSQWFAVFDPASPGNLCLEFGTGGVPPPEAIWSNSRQLFLDGFVMVLAMMFPGALRQGGIVQARRHRLFFKPELWTFGYLAAWGVFLFTAACVAAAVHIIWQPLPELWLAIKREASMVLTVLAVLLQLRLFFLWKAHVPAIHKSCSYEKVDPWNTGISAGHNCIAQCTLPMLAVHSIYGMSLPAMVLYALWFWWCAGGASRWPHALAAIALAGSAILK